MRDRSEGKATHCAIYTRKSSEEGLEQDLSSLHAQREACEAYVTSQKHEGWRALPNTYDDGGFSGGSMERPGLDRLLADVQAGTIDVGCCCARCRQALEIPRQSPGAGSREIR